MMVRRYYFHAAALCACVLVAACNEEQPGTVEDRALTGTWLAESDTLCESYVFQGAGFRRFLYVPGGDTVWIRRGTFEEDTTRRPWWVDLTVTYDSSATGKGPSGMLRGIFALSGDTLRIAVPHRLGYPERPPNFSTIYDWYSVSVLLRHP